MMRSALVVFGILACVYSVQLEFGHQFKGVNLLPRNAKVFEDTINETLECIRYNLENGLPEYNFPSIQTISVEDFYLDVDNLNISSATGYAHLRNLLFAGLTTFYAPEINGQLSVIPLGYRLDITIVFRNFDLNTLYDLEMVVDDMHVHGDGTLSWNIEDLSFKLGVFLSITGGVSIRDLSILIHIGSSHAVISGWFDDEEHSEIFSDLFNDYLVPAWVNNQPESINEILSPILEELINSILATSSVKAALDDGFLEALINCDAMEKLVV